MPRSQPGDKDQGGLRVQLGSQVLQSPRLAPKGSHVENRALRLGPRSGGD